MPHRLDKLDSAPLQVGLGLYEIWHGIDRSNFILKVPKVIPNVVIPSKSYSDRMEVVNLISLNVNLIGLICKICKLKIF